MNTKTGSKEYFDLDWGKRKEKTHRYFCQGEPHTQLQLAFKNHYEVFDKLFFHGEKGKSLEVGCGRGNMSLYFAYHGWETYLLDQSKNAIEVAKDNFKELKLSAKEFIVANAEKIPYPNDTFDTVFSIGLLEHFDDPEPIVKEQIRVLKKGGIFIGYIVPSKISVQTLFKPINITLSLLKLFIDKDVDKFKKPKDLLFRNTYNSNYYLSLLDRLSITEKGSFGIFPIPLISYSEIYPFTPLPDKLEKIVTFLDKLYLNIRRLFSKHPWICSEIWGQAFVVWGKK